MYDGFKIVSTPFWSHEVECAPMSQDDYVRTALRLPRQLHARLHEEADAKGRSFNAEIIDGLQRAMSVTPLKDKTIDYVEHIEQTNALRDLVGAKDLQLQNQSMFFNLLCAVVPSLYESLPADRKRDPALKAVVSIANQVNHGEGNPAQALAGFLSGRAAPPMVAVHVRQALDLLKLASHEAGRHRQASAGQTLVELEPPALLHSNTAPDITALAGRPRSGANENLFEDWRSGPLTLEHRGETYAMLGDADALGKQLRLRGIDYIPIDGGLLVSAKEFKEKMEAWQGRSPQRSMTMAGRRLKPAAAVAEPQTQPAKRDRRAK